MVSKASIALKNKAYNTSPVRYIKAVMVLRVFWVSWLQCVQTYPGITFQMR
jgi:hypothetical protein